MAFSLEEPVVQSYIVYSAILAMKLIALAPYTGVTRLMQNAFMNPEDHDFFSLKKGKINLNDPEVERVRRAHLNDLENIPVFWILGALYLTTNPAAAWATLLFRVYTLGRIVHTIVYAIVVMPQPARAIAFFPAYVIQWYFGIQVVLHYATAL